ncbi:MAG TPA: LytTR family DNA-binding domain-containing protein [Bacteroidota bacterium]
MRIIIVDDEDLARSIVREHLQNHPDAEIVAECANGFEAVKAVTELKPDLIFLDIQMPKLSGFEVLELLQPPPAVIFVTAFDEYALKAFDVHAVDYLLKPFSRERFDEAFQRAAKRLTARSPGVEELLADARKDRKPLERIVVRDGASVTVIPVARVDYIEAQDDYVCIHTAGKKHLKEEPLAELESLLDPSRFVRIHRSYLLNLERLARLETYARESRIAILSDGTKLPVSRSGYEKLRRLL